MIPPSPNSNSKKTDLRRGRIAIKAGSADTKITFEEQGLLLSETETERDDRRPREIPGKI